MHVGLNERFPPVLLGKDGWEDRRVKSDLLQKIERWILPRIRNHTNFYMLIAVGNTISTPSVPTLVATTLPNSIALRVPSDNVAPSISSAQLDNNASGNRFALAKNDPSLAVLTNPRAEIFSSITNSNSAPITANAQTAFLAQLAGGDISSETQSIFLQYEKLLNYANVKYKPSNAGKPVEPVGIFKNILKSENVYTQDNIDIDDDLPEAENDYQVQVPEITSLRKNIEKSEYIRVRINLYQKTSISDVDNDTKKLEEV